MKESDHLEELHIDGITILKLVLKNFARYRDRWLALAIKIMNFPVP
jgi:hypothetical protein